MCTTSFIAWPSDTWPASHPITLCRRRLYFTKLSGWLAGRSVGAPSPFFCRGCPSDVPHPCGYCEVSTDGKTGRWGDRNHFRQACIFQPRKSRDLLLIDDALTRLAEIDARRSRIVELRFFGGLTVEETAMVLAVSERTVLREWNVAKAWLYQEINRLTGPY